MELEWRPSHSASCLHAAEAHVRGAAFADDQLRAAVRSAADTLHQEILSSGLPSQRLWRELVAWSGTLANNEELARQAIVKTAGLADRYESLVSRIAEHVAALESAVTRERPQLAAELSLRTGPLREQWEARGPGLLQQLRRLTTAEIFSERATVILVHPALGGSGRSHLPSNTVHIEALLVNADSQLPEVLRLAWLLAQLQLDLPRFSERVSGERLPILAELALLPAVLAAAEHVELGELSAARLCTALELWRVEMPAEATSDLVIDWWETYRDQSPPFHVALQALEQMLFDS